MTNRGLILILFLFFVVFFYPRIFFGFHFIDFLFNPFDVFWYKLVQIKWWFFDHSLSKLLLLFLTVVIVYNLAQRKKEYN
ncbi:MAG: hypothetical protein AAFX87_24230 [Bacteroidota bacterium]